MELQGLTIYLNAIAKAEEKQKEVESTSSMAQADLANFRSKASMTQTDLANATGRTQAYVSQVEKGEHLASPRTLNMFYSAIAETAKRREDAYNNKEEKSDEEE